MVGHLMMKMLGKGLCDLHGASEEHEEEVQLILDLGQARPISGSFGRASVGLEDEVVDAGHQVQDGPSSLHRVVHYDGPWSWKIFCKG